MEFRWRENTSQRRDRLVSGSVRVAVAQGAADELGAEGRLRHAATLAARAASESADLLVLPQLFLGGPPDGTVGPGQRAELSDGASARRLGEIAGAHGIALLCGYVELCTGRHYDAALLVDASGRARASYRRTHLVPERDEPALAPGQWLTVAPLGSFKLGLLIGTDIEGPEAARALALAGAHLLVVAARHGAQAGSVAALLPARAAENRCGLAYANGIVEPGAPPSCLIGPDGRVVAQATAGLAVATLPACDPAQALARDLARRPRLYQRLVAPMPGEDAPRL